MATLILRPYRDYSSTNWTRYPATGEHYEKVNEVTANGDTDYIYIDTSSGWARFYFDTAAYAGLPYTINSVKHVLKYKYSGDPTDSYLKVAVRVYMNGAYRNWGEGTADVPGSADSYHTKEMISTVEGWYGNPWTWSMIHDMKAGPWVSKTGALNYVRVTQYYIEIDYDPQLSTVTTQAATNIKGNYCTGNGNVTDDGGDNIIERGFEFGLSEEAQFCVRQKGTDLGDGAYSLTIDGLKSETTYYYRAYATNSVGDSYGNWVSFTNTALPTYGVHEETSTPTICFYVRAVGGKWSIKYGPYTTDQADIEITKLLTEGTGKYQIKFTSDVLTGLSASIMTKLDIKAR